PNWSWSARPARLGARRTTTTSIFGSLVSRSSSSSGRNEITMRSWILTSAAAGALLIAGCKAGVKTIPSTADGSTDKPTPPPQKDAARDVVRFEVPGTDPDSACAAESGGAQPVPLALYMMMDTSRSMNVLTAANVSKWDAVRTAMKSFFDASDGTAVGLAYFPAEQAGLPATCLSDGECLGTTCDRRRGCV